MLSCPGAIGLNYHQKVGLPNWGYRNDKNTKIFCLSSEAKVIRALFMPPVNILYDIGNFYKRRKNNFRAPQ